VEALELSLLVGILHISLLELRLIVRLLDLRRLLNSSHGRLGVVLEILFHGNLHDGLILFGILYLVDFTLHL
jgi:hypothetical protein